MVGRSVRSSQAVSRCVSAHLLSLHPSIIHDINLQLPVQLHNRQREIQQLPLVPHEIHFVEQVRVLAPGGDGVRHDVVAPPRQFVAPIVRLFLVHGEPGGVEDADVDRLGRVGVRHGDLVEHSRDVFGEDAAVGAGYGFVD